MSFADPTRTLSQFGLSEGARVADFGAGSGAYTLAASALVGVSGRVYAVDVQKDFLTRIKNSAGESGVKNVEVVWGDVEKSGGTKLRDYTLDAVIVSNLLFQLEDREGCLAEATRVLKARGRVLLVDWSGSFGNMGPRPQEVVTKSAARALFEHGGFTLEREIEAGGHHYGLVMRKT
ncbi:MAG: methyltransferase domain-containing protein [bacterium]|nr:methyltransferase domain-containing protein [bacterium]MDZ4284249.1 methyltransferase domain-containing protein [Patescibacteria group bacterium]